MDADFHGLLSRVQTLPDAPETCPAVKPGELICDPYAGGGTMAVACQELGRDCITFECDEETYNKAQRRIKEAGKQQPLPLVRATATQLQLGE